MVSMEREGKKKKKRVKLTDWYWNVWKKNKDQSPKNFNKGLDYLVKRNKDQNPSCDRKSPKISRESGLTILIGLGFHFGLNWITLLDPTDGPADYLILCFFK